MARVVVKPTVASRKVPTPRPAPSLPQLPKEVPAEQSDESFIDALIPTEVELIEVTPDLAAYWLTLNTRNRKIKDGQLAKIVSDLEEGNWRYTGESIKFSKTGVLLDGQHRLAAIVKTGITLNLLVVPGLEDESQDVMDSQSTRGARDALTLRGEGDSSLLAAAVRLALVLEAAPSYSRRDSISTSKILNWLDANPDMREAAHQAQSYRRLPMAKSVIAYCIWQLNKIAPDECQEFFRDLTEHRTEGFGDPRNTLLDRLITLRKSKNRLSQLILVSMVFRTWNSIRMGKRLTVLKVTYNGDMVDIPVPK